VKAILAALSLALAGATLALAPLDADAQRIGRGRPAGMQRQLPPKPVQQQPPAQQATPQTPAAAAAAAPAPRRSWMGPIAGIAAGLGIAALLSHFGLGEAAANMLTLALLALVVIFVVRWLLRRMRQPAPAYAGAGAGAGVAPPLQRSMQEFSASPPAASPAELPAGFDVPAFERIAKLLFVRLQAANDAGQLDDLRKFTTPELFASLQVDLHERAGKPQRTDVVQLDATVVETIREGDQWIASVRFSGLIREQAEAVAEPFDEVWHFVKPADDSRDWAIAGITPGQ
jgi:predicted lipid-binding transport protein (Tim44 family)